MPGPRERLDAQPTLPNLRCRSPCRLATPASTWHPRRAHSLCYHVKASQNADPGCSRRKQYQTQLLKKMHLSGGEGHCCEDDRGPGDQPVYRISSPQPWQHDRSGHGAQTERRQQEAVSLGSVRLADHRKQRQQRRGAKTERPGANQYGTHLRCASHVAKALNNGVAHTSCR